MIEWILLVIGLIVGLLIGYYFLDKMNRQKFSLDLEKWKNAYTESIRLDSQNRYSQEFEKWKTTQCDAIRLEEQQKAAFAFEKWKTENEGTIRKDTLDRSRAILKGKIGEQFVPILPLFVYNPADTRFIGNPIDFIVFNGYTDVKDGIEDEVKEIVFVEVKTGKTKQLSTTENRIKKAVESKRVRWETIQIRLLDEPTFENEVTPPRPPDESKAI